VVYRLQRIPTFHISGRTRTSTIPSIPRAITFNGFTVVVREPHVRSYIVCGNIRIKGHLIIRAGYKVVVVV